MPEPHLQDPCFEEPGSSKLTLSPTLEAHSPPREWDGFGEKRERTPKLSPSRSHLIHPSASPSRLSFSWCLLPPGGSKPGPCLAIQPRLPSPPSGNTFQSLQSLPILSPREPTSRNLTQEPRMCAGMLTAALLVCKRLKQETRGSHWTWSHS